MSYYGDEIGISTLESALYLTNVEDLKTLAQLTGKKVPTKKDHLVALIRGFLAEDRLRLLWGSLDDMQRAAVAETVHSQSSHFNVDKFRAKYGRDPVLLSRGYGSSRKASSIDFFFYRQGVIPDDLIARLRGFVPKPAETAIATVDPLPLAYGRPFVRWEEKTKKEGTEEVPLSVHETELAAQRELISILRLVDSGKVAVSAKTHRPSASAVETITALLENGEYYQYVIPKNEWSDDNAGPIRAFAWPALLQAGGLAQILGQRLQLTKAGRKALSEPPAESLRVLWAKWRSNTLFDELSRVDCVKGQTGKGKRGLTALYGRREAVADSLAGCPVGAWIATDGFCATCKPRRMRLWRLVIRGHSTLANCNTARSVMREAPRF